MKYTIVLALALTTTFGFSQKRQMQQVDPEKRAQQKIDRLDAELQLNENQKEELKIYFTEVQKESRVSKREMVQRRSANQTVSADGSDLKTVRNNSMNSRKEATEEKMKSILSDDQFKKWKEMKEERGERVSERQRRGVRKGEARGQRGERQGKERDRKRVRGNRG